MQVFVGSSTEAKKVLHLLSAWIQQEGHTPIPWDQPGLFPPGEPMLQRLIRLAREVDAAIMIFNEDDMVWYRGDGVRQPRDNVLVEYGLFASMLGPKHAIACVNGAPRLAADFQGLNYINISPSYRATARLELAAWLQSVTEESVQATPKHVRIWRGRDKVSPSFYDLLKEAKRRIFLVGFSFETMLVHHGLDLSEALNNNPSLTAKILMLHPRSKHVIAHQEFRKGPIAEKIMGVIDHDVHGIYQQLSPSAKKRLDVRLTNYLPRFAVRLYDDVMLLNFYLYKRRAQINPVIEIHSTDHDEEFDGILYAMEELFQYQGDPAEGYPPNHKVIDDGKWVGPPRS